MSHPNCVRPDGHTCQRPTRRPCLKRRCNEPAGTIWSPLWCPEHDAERLDRIKATLDGIARRSGA